MGDGNELFYRYGFGEVAGLIDVLAFVDGDIVGEQLQGYRGHDGGEAFVYLRYVEAIIGDVIHRGVALADDGQHVSAAALDLLNVGDNLVVKRIARGDDHAGHLLIDQGYRTVFHLGGGITLGVDVGDFLKFQSSFECGGVVVAATEIEEVAGIGEYVGELLDAGSELEHFLDGLGEGADEQHLGIREGRRIRQENRHVDIVSAEHHRYDRKVLRGCIDRQHGARQACQENRRLKQVAVSHQEKAPCNGEKHSLKQIDIIFCRRQR